MKLYITPDRRMREWRGSRCWKLERSALVCDYLDRLDAKPVFDLPSGSAGLEARRMVDMREKEIGHAYMRGPLTWRR